MACPKTVIARRNVCFDVAIQCALANSIALLVDRRRLRLRDDGTTVNLYNYLTLLIFYCKNAKKAYFNNLSCIADFLSSFSRYC